MLAAALPCVRDSDQAGPIGRTPDLAEASTLGGAAHETALHDRTRRDRVGGGRPERQLSASDPVGIASQAYMSLGFASVAGATAGCERPDAMLTRGARVTGSGGASCSVLSADTSDSGPTIALPDGAVLSFASLADFRPERCF